MERGNARLKFFDRCLGTFLLLALTPLRFFRRSRVPAVIRNVGLLKTAAIGDTVLVSAIIDDLCAFNPSIQVILFVGGSNAAFASRLAGVEIIQLPLTNPLKAVRMIREHDFDLFIDFDPWPRISALLSSLSRARLRIGFRTRGQYRHYTYDRALEHRSDRHELENYRTLVSGLGIVANSVPQKFGYEWSGGAQTIVFHLWPSGTQSHLKQWAPKHWAQLARALGDFEFVLSGGKEDVERSVDFINHLPADLASRFRSMAGASFESTFQLLQKSALLVSVNTGVMHVGAAIGVPTVGLHGPTNPLRWGPIGPRVRAVASKMPGAGKLNLGFEYLDDTNYMDGIDSSEVLTACRELLGEHNPRS